MENIKVGKNKRRDLFAEMAKVGEDPRARWAFIDLAHPTLFSVWLHLRHQIY